MGQLEIVTYPSALFDDREAVFSLLIDFSLHLSKSNSSSQPLRLEPEQINQQMDLFERLDETLLIAKIEDAVIGCVGLRSFENSSYENTCEMIFLFVKPAFRGFGFGHQLVGGFLDLAREKHYSHVLFDPLNEHEAIRQIYDDFGFEEIPPLGHRTTSSSTLMLLNL